MVRTETRNGRSGHASDMPRRALGGKRSLGGPRQRPMRCRKPLMRSLDRGDNVRGLCAGHTPIVSVNSLEVILGPMFSGKSRTLISRLASAAHSGQVALAARPSLGRATQGDRILSRDGSAWPAQVVATSHDLVAVARSADIVAVDEVQFFGTGLIDAVAAMRESAMIVLAGLDLDFRGEPFGSTLEIAKVASAVTCLTATCAVCGGVATRTQRLVGGLPATVDAPTVVLDDRACYEPRCLLCFNVAANQGQAV